MARVAYNREEVKQQFFAIVQCFGIERIRFGNYRPLFRDDPIMMAILDNYLAEQKRLKGKSRENYYGPGSDESGKREYN